MRVEELTDEELMLKYQKGDEKAFSALYERLSPKVYGYLKSKVHKTERANDIFQEVFVKIHKTKHLYKKDFPVLPWIFTITKNLMIDELRKSKNEKNHVDVDEMELAAVETLSTHTQSVETLRPALNEIAPNQKLAIEMRYINEKSFDEIALALNTNAENVRQLISRGIKRIKEIVKEDET